MSPEGSQRYREWYQRLLQHHNALRLSLEHVGVGNLQTRIESQEAR